MMSVDYREICLDEHGEVCTVCDGTEVIVAHHLDGDRSNNRLSNLIPLCYSCHLKVHSHSEHGPEIDKYTELLPEESVNRGPYSKRNSNDDLNGVSTGKIRQKTTSAIIDERGRVTIPKPARRALGIEGEETVAELTIRIDEYNDE